MNLKSTIRTEEEILIAFKFKEEIFLELVRKVDSQLEKAISKRYGYIYISIQDYLIVGFDYSNNLLKILEGKKYRCGDFRKNEFFPVIKVLLTT
jgi:hypothetical protein